MQENQKAVACLFAATLLWSIGGLLIKWIDWNPMAISGMRGVVAGLFLGLVLRQPRFDWSAAQIGGGIAYAVTTFGYVLATKWTTAANAIFLLYTAPIYIALFGAWFLGEQSRWTDWITVLVVLGGMVLVFLDSLTVTGFWGNVSGLVSGLSFGWLVLFLRKQKSRSPLESILLGNVLTALLGLPFMFGSLPDMAGWTGLILMGVFQIGLAFLFYAWAIKRVKAFEAVLIPLIEPILNPLWVFLVMGERPGPWASVGGALVLTAVAIRGLTMIKTSPLSN